ncbi:hypothetical protein RHMOL_Rhmol11G0105300 [Rhododendron molle]|uniref:Uncharacterized protein n=1 Tax=Rhododendron molle TaxID=49168 RepID=A0ACC0LQS7_RHOML|nr:hypothetical protein RHMOL_Rhmol11G0105300 [Rhododendron molle]
MVLYSSVYSTVLLRISEPSDHASDGLDLISVTNDREPFITEMRSKPSDTRSNGSEVRNTVLHIPLHSTVPQLILTSGWFKGGLDGSSAANSGGSESGFGSKEHSGGGLIVAVYGSNSAKKANRSRWSGVPAVMDGGWDAGRLWLARIVFGTNDIRRVHDGLRDSSGVPYPD